MFKNHGRYLVEFLLPGRIALFLKSYESLYFKFDRSERVLDLMCNLAGHLTPRLVSFGLSQLSCGI